jgi:predicted ATPase
MVYLTEVSVNDETWIKRIGKEHLVFTSRVSLLVGPNGSGKSSTLALIKQFIEKKRDSSRKSTFKATKCSTMFLDTEKTLRASNGFIYELTQIAMKWCSHGEAMKVYWRSIARQKDPTVFFIDEPEAGTDHKGLEELIRTVQDSEHQFIIATHHPLLWCMENADLIVFGEDSEYPLSCMNRLRKDLINFQGQSLRR